MIRADYHPVTREGDRAAAEYEKVLKSRWGSRVARFGMCPGCPLDECVLGFGNCPDGHNSLDDLT